MGNYFNPPEHINQVGRQLMVSSWNDLNAQLQKNEMLVCLYDRGMFKNCPQLFSENEFNEFEEQVNEGRMKRIGFFAVEAKQVFECGQFDQDPQKWTAQTQKAAT